MHHTRNADYLLTSRTPTQQQQQCDLLGRVRQCDLRNASKCATTYRLANMAHCHDRVCVWAWLGPHVMCLDMGLTQKTLGCTSASKSLYMRGHAWYGWACGQLGMRGMHGYMSAEYLGTSWFSFVRAPCTSTHTYGRGRKSSYLRDGCLGIWTWHRNTPTRTTRGASMPALAQGEYFGYSQLYYHDKSFQAFAMACTCGVSVAACFPQLLNSASHTAHGSMVVRWAMWHCSVPSVSTSGIHNNCIACTWVRCACCFDVTMALPALVAGTSSHRLKRVSRLHASSRLALSALPLACHGPSGTVASCTHLTACG